MSKRLLVLLPVFLAIATNCFSSMQPLCHDDDSSALLQFKESFDMNLNACRGNPFAYPKIAILETRRGGQRLLLLGWC
jgi:hypothetical protein